MVSSFFPLFLFGFMAFLVVEERWDLISLIRFWSRTPFQPSGLQGLVRCHYEGDKGYMAGRGPSGCELQLRSPDMAKGSSGGMNHDSWHNDND